MYQFFLYFSIIYIILIYLLLIFSIITLFFERKLIAIAQKRLGISFLGRNGWIHLPADMVKFWFKQSNRHTSLWLSNLNSFIIILFGFFCWNSISCIFFIANGGDILLDNWDYQILFYFGYANITAVYMFYIVISAKSKFATIASIRVLLLSIFLEVFFAICFLFLFLHIGGYSFNDVNTSNQYSWLLIAIPPLSLIFGIYALFEAKRAPFDHTEAESELVSGHLIEFGGRLLLLFYFSEYIHAYFCMYLIIILVFGGTHVLNISYLSFFYFF